MLLEDPQPMAWAMVWLCICRAFHLLVVKVTHVPFAFSQSACKLGLDELAKIQQS
jgi:hypothetical protein